MAVIRRCGLSLLRFVPHEKSAQPPPLGIGFRPTRARCKGDIDKSRRDDGVELPSQHHLP